MITVLHYRLQQEQEKGEDSDSVPNYSDASSSYNKGKHAIVVAIQLMIIHKYIFRHLKSNSFPFFALEKCDNDKQKENTSSFSHVTDVVCKAKDWAEPTTHTPPAAEQCSSSLGNYTFFLSPSHTHRRKHDDEEERKNRMC